ncbi:protoporphyrinogen oxidase [soil metagenome]
MAPIRDNPRASVGDRASTALTGDALREPRVVIIGGGITGLSAAFELASRQVPFTLCEASNRAGGLILTDRVDGFTIEAGPDSVLAQKPAALELCEALGLTPKVIATRQPRTAYVLRAGRLHALPFPSVLGVPTTLAGIASYDLLPWSARLRLAGEPLVRRAAPDDESVASFFRARFGAATVGLVAQPLLGGIHAGDVEQLSMRSLFPRFADAESRHGSVLRAFRRQRSRPDGLFRSLSGGMDELVRAIERRLPRGSVRVGAAVSQLAWAGDRWVVTTGPDHLRARAVILALPAPAAARLLDPLDPVAAALCREVPYVSTASVAMAWRREDVPHPLDGSGFVVARSHNPLRITACTWVSSKWEGRAPAGTVLLRVFIGGSHDPEAVSLPENQLVETAWRETSAVLGMSVPPLFARVYRWPDAGAQHNVGQRARVAGIERRLAVHAGLFVAGSGFRSVGIPDCVADGRAAGAAAAHFATMNISPR